VEPSDLLTQHDMSPTSDVNPQKPLPQDPLAVELGNLRQHFSPTMFSASSLPIGSERIPQQDTLVDRRSPLPLDNSFVQQTKDQIRSIVETIAVLANSPIEPQAFVAAALPKIVQAMGGKGAGLWQRLPNATWRLLGTHQLPDALIARGNLATTTGHELTANNSQSSFDTLDFLENEIRSAEETAYQANNQANNEARRDQPSELHLAVLNAVAREKQPILIPPGNVALSRDRPVNPIDDLLMFAPLPISNEYGEFWLQVVQAPSGGPSSQRGYLRFVAQMADLLSDHFRSYRLRVFERDRNYLSIAEHTMNDLSVGLPPALGLSRLMTILREHANSEHAFLLRKDTYYGRWRVVAAAGLVEIDRRADGIEQIELASKCFETQLPGGGSMLSEQLDEPVDSRDPDLTGLMQMFAVSELLWAKPLQMHSISDSRKRRQDVALLLTWSGLDRAPARCLEQSSLIARLGLSALQLPWWKACLVASKQYRPSIGVRLHPSSWPRSARWLIAIGLLACLLAIPVPIRLHATAVLVPKVQQHVYCPLDAIVEKVFVEHGQSVSVGTPLLRLQSPTLNAEYEQSAAQQLRNSQRILDITAKLLRETSLSPAQRDELEGERQALKDVQEVEQIKLNRLQHQMDSLLIVAELDGVIATWNIQDNLRNRPLRTGQWLLSLHEAGSKWTLEASLPESDAFEFRQAMQTEQELPVATLTGTPQKPIRVHYIPDNLTRIDNGAINPSQGATPDAVLRLRFDVDPADLSEGKTVPGATARISIPNGRGPLIWALSKDFVRKLWTQVQLWV
jgi:multidrug efflux pump subunit AcrA (membrane-fusion protein)